MGSEIYVASFAIFSGREHFLSDRKSLLQVEKQVFVSNKKFVINKTTWQPILGLPDFNAIKFLDDVLKIVTQ